MPKEDLAENLHKKPQWLKNMYRAKFTKFTKDKGGSRKNTLNLEPQRKPIAVFKQQEQNPNMKLINALNLHVSSLHILRPVSLINALNFASDQRLMRP